MYLREGLANSFRAYADRPAIFQEKSQISYRELDASSARIAGWLEREHQGDHVALLCDRSVEVVAAHIACIRAGKKLVLIDEREPFKRIESILQTLRCNEILISGTQNANIGDSFVVLKEVIENSSESTAWFDWELDEVAWVYFTSGTTGDPKGVAVPYRRRIPGNFMSGGLEPEHVVGISRPLSFLAGGTAVYSALQAGTLVHLIDLSEMAPLALLDYMNIHRLTHATLPPSLLRDTREPKREIIVASCVEIGLTGERATQSDLKKLRAVFPNATLQNSYGSTELGTVARYPIRPSDHIPEDPIPVGPEFDCEVHIVNESLELVGTSEVGQIAAVSPRRSPHYVTPSGVISLNQFELKPGIQAVLTGDAGFRDKDGLLHVVGRLDDIVKINGNLINTATVQAVLVRHPDVIDSEVLSFLNRRGRQRIGALVCLRAGSTAVEADLREYILQELPAWMIPTKICLLNVIPRTERGKTDRRALMRLLTADPGTVVVNANLGDPIVWRMYRILRELVDLGAVRETENLQFCGLDSLDAIEFVERIKEEFSVRLPLSFLVSWWSLASLKEWIVENATSTPNRIVLGRIGSQPLDLYWLMPGLNIITGMSLANHLEGFTSRFLVARGAESKVAPHLSIDLVAQELVEQFVRNAEGRDFVLLGFSSAGWIVQHMAVIMERIGMPPRLLVLLDPPFGESVETSTAPPAPQVLMLAREGQFSSLPTHEADVDLLALQMFGLRHHQRHNYSGKTLVVTAKPQEEFEDKIKAAFSVASVVRVQSEHLELMRDPQVCGPILSRALYDEVAALSSRLT